MPDRTAPASTTITFTPPRDRRGSRTAPVYRGPRQVAQARRALQHVTARQDATGSAASRAAQRPAAPVGLLGPLPTGTAVAADPRPRPQPCTEVASALDRPRTGTTRPQRAGRRTSGRGATHWYLRVVTGPRGCRR